MRPTFFLCDFLFAWTPAFGCDGPGVDLHMELVGPKDSLALVLGILAVSSAMSAAMFSLLHLGLWLHRRALGIGPQISVFYSFRVSVWIVAMDSSLRSLVLFSAVPYCHAAYPKTPLLVFLFLC